jgi:O-glycosyl hydrolase
MLKSWVQRFRKLHFCLTLSVCLAAALATIQHANAQTVSVIETTGTESELLTPQPSVTFGTATGGTYTITVNPNVMYQQMDGFGASFTDSSTYNIYNYLTAAQQSALMTSLFSSTSGIGLTMLRQPMGASDLSAQGDFSYDDMPAGETDVPLANFNITKDLTYTIPVLKEALAVNPNIKIEMLPWSPPAWMKLSGTMNGGDFNDTYMPSLAQYFVKAIQAYQSQLNTTIYAINPQNEPENSNGSYPTETFSATEEEDFIANNLGPALQSAGLSPKIFGYEHNWGDTTYPETLLAYSPAAAYIAGISWHCYSGNVTAQSTVEAAYPTFGNWFTECSGETSGNFAGDFGWGMENIILGAPNNWAKGVTEWNLALNENSGPTNGGCTNCYGFVTINTSVSPATVTPTTSYYTFGMANGVVPGAYRIQSNSAAIAASGIEDTAYLNPNGSVTLIVYNDATTSTTFDVNWAPSNINFVYTLPANSAATFYWTPAGTIVPPTNLAVTTPSGTSTQLNLSWTASTTSGVTYDVYRSTTNGFTPSSSSLVASGVTTTTYNNTGLATGTTYYYVVEAVDSSGASGPSNQASGTTGAVTPAAPTGLTATAASDAQINLSWTATTTTGSITYSVYRSTTSGFTPGSGNLVTSGLSATSYSNTGLAAGTTYYYVVEAVNSAGSSPASNQASAATPAAPAAPTSVTATASSSTQINLSWTASTTSGVTYSVYCSTTSGFTPSSSTLIASGVTTTTYSDTGLSAATTYYYVVEAVNSNGSSAPSNQASATTLVAPPVAPTALTVTVASSTQVNLSWTASTTGGTLTYSVYRSTTSGFTPGSGNLVTSGLTTTSYNNTGLTAVTTYYYVVEAVNSAGSSPASNQVTAITPATSTGISTTGYYTIVNEASGSCLDDTNGSTSNGTVLQQYTCGSGNDNQEWQFTVATGVYYEVTTYNLNMLAWNVVNAGTSSGTDMQLWAYTAGLNEEFEPVLLSTGYYEFVDRNSGLCLNVPGGANTNGLQLQINTCSGSSSESFSLIAVATTVPAAPTSLTASAVSNDINLSWTASTTTNVNSYSVYRSTTSGFTPSSSNLIASDVTTTTYADNGLAASTTYYYVVEAVNSVGSSAPSNQASATTPAAAGPAAPTSLTATAASSVQINLSWTASTTSGVTYSVYRGTASGFTPSSSTLVTSGLSSTTYSNTGLTASTTYYYVVEAVNSNGSSPASNQASATTASTGTISTTSYYTIVNEASGSCIDDTGGSTSNGTVLQQWACTAGDVNQEWLFTSVGSGYYEVTTYNSGTLAWNVVNLGTSPGTDMQLWTYGGGLNEQFEPVQLSTGYYEFIDHNSGLCLNVPGGATTNGLQLQINTCNGSTSESFTLQTITAGAPAAPTSLTATAASSVQINLSWTASTTSGVTYSVYSSKTSGFTPSSSNLVASGLSTTTYSNTGLTASTTYYYVVEAVYSSVSSAASNQASATTSASGSGLSTTVYYQIVNEASGSCIDDTGGSTSNGAVLQQWACATIGTNTNQEWLFTSVGSGYYEVTTYNSGTLAWNVVNLGTSPGTDMQLWTYGGGLNEQFEPVQLSTGYYEFIDHNSGLCLNVPGGATTNGLQLQINTCNGSTSESFTLNEL